MNDILNWIRVNIISWITPPKAIEIIDIIQIILIAWFVYHVILWIENTRGYTLLKGILLILGFVVVANIFHMDVIVFLIANVSTVAITAIVIIFQPELRKVLEQVGQKNPINSLFFLGSRAERANLWFSDNTINELVRACFEMSEVKTGALIVLERMVRIDEIAETGIPIDAILSGQLLINIFEHNTPLHDGAVIVREDRVLAATCYLPLSENTVISKRYGTRHRAAVGVSEISDSITVVVSEENGRVSYVMDGILHPNVTPSELKDMLYSRQKRFAGNARDRRKTDEK